MNICNKCICKYQLFNVCENKILYKCNLSLIRCGHLQVPILRPVL